MISEAATSSSLQRNQAELLQFATRCAQRGEHEQARTFLHAILEKDLRHELALGMLAASYADSGNLETAVELFKRVLDTNAKNVLARFQLSELLLASSKPQEALNIWCDDRDAEDNCLAQFCCGRAQLMLGEIKGARARFALVDQHAPTEHPLRRQLEGILDNFPDDT